MSQIKSLAKDTAIYGVSNIINKFLNYLLVPFYTYILQTTSEYGVITNLYSWMALVIVVLTYGMETGFFRFINKPENDANQVYSTTLCSLFTTSLLFALCVTIWQQPIASAMGYRDHADYIFYFGWIMAMDAFNTIPFAYLRYKNRPWRFAIIKFIGVLVNIGANLFFLLACPRIAQHSPQLIDWFYRPNYEVGYVCVSNLLTTIVTTLCLLPFVFEAKFNFSLSLLKQMLRYSLPLLILGIAGIMNQHLDKIMMPYLFDSVEEGNAQLGIYGACAKLAMVMMIFIQAFRYAYEPFVFAKNNSRNSVGAYSDATKYFTIFALLIIIGMVAYMDILRLIISPAYWSGLKVVPIILLSYLFEGIYFNLSIWYKLTDRTIWGAAFSLIGLTIIVVLNIVLVPKIGYMGCAWASLACFLTCMLLSYFVGQKKYPIPYDLKSMAVYFGITIVLLGIYYGCKYAFTQSDLMQHEMFGYTLKGYHISFLRADLANLLIGTCAVVAYLALLFKRDFPISSLPIVGKYFKNNQKQS